jgi:SH3-like domain-containing protein
MHASPRPGPRSAVPARRPAVRAALLAAALLVAPATGAAAGPAFVRVSVDVANLREGPGTRYEAAGQAIRNDPLRVLRRRGPWLRARTVQGREAWILASLTDRRPAVVVQVAEANVRSGPGTGHAVVFRALRGVPFRVVDTSGAWLRVRHADGDSGWIHEKLVWGER